MSTYFSNNYNDFSYWFGDTIIDPNGNNVSDINAGIAKLYTELVDQLNNTENNHTRFIVPECQVAMPDIAAQTFYNYEHLWWYICLANLIDNPFVQYNDNYLFYAFSQKLLEEQSLIEAANNNSQTSKIGTIIELN